MALGNALISKGSFSEGLVSSKVETSTSVPAEVRKVASQLRELVASLDKGSLATAVAEAGLDGRGYVQQIRCLATEIHPEILSRDLYQLACSEVHSTHLGVVAQKLLVILSGSKLQDASRATHRLDVLAGRGGSMVECAAQALQQVSRGEHYGPLALALASASLLGKSAGLITRNIFGNRGITGLTLELAGGGAKLGVEALAFPGTSAVGRGVFGQSMGIKDYWGEAGHGLLLMGGLGLGARLGKLSYLSLHSAKANGALTRLRGLSLFTKPASHLGPELSVLTAINYKQQGGDLSFNAIGGLATMCQLRGAQSLNAAVFYRLPALMRRLDLANYQAVRNASTRAWRSVSNLWGQGGGLSMGRPLAAAGGGVVPKFLHSKSIRTERFNPNVYYENKGPTATGTPESPRFSSAVRDALVFPEGPQKFYSSLKSEMEADGARARSPFTETRWIAFKEIVDQAAERALDPHDAAYELMEIMYKGLVEKILDKSTIPEGPIFHGNFRDADILVDPNDLASLPEEMALINRVSIPVNTELFRSDPLVRANVGYLYELIMLHNALLTPGRSRSGPLSLRVRGLNNSFAYLHYPQPAGYLEYFAHPNTRAARPAGKRTPPQFWLTHGVGLTGQKRLPLNQGRYLLLSPFAQDLIHSRVNDKDSQLIILPNKQIALHPMVGLYHDLEHTALFDLLPPREIHYQEGVAQLYEAFISSLDNPNLAQYLRRSVYDFGGSVLSCLHKKEIDDVYFLLFVEGLVAARDYGRLDEFTKFMEQHIAAGQDSGKIGSQKKIFWDILNFYFNKAKSYTTLKFRN